jgi:cholera toxin transcriptional activator
MPLSSSSHESRLLRFGVFEADLTAGELRKNGARIRLQEQPFQVLTALLQNPGQVVTRESLREAIWPADTFVDFDHSLNTAVNKIRESLGDSASNPRFVETLARRGYRFIATVEDIAITAPGKSRPTPPESANALHPELHVPIPARGVVRSLFALIQAMYLIFYLSGLSHLGGVDRIAGTYLSGQESLFLVGTLLLTGAVGIPLRLYLLSAVAFDFRQLADAFTRLLPFVFVLDLLWAVAPFLLLRQIGIGMAFAATAALLYVPFSEKTLIRMAYRQEK